jgi:RNA polymerase sigma-70 factor (ECF subfamily)
MRRNDEPNGYASSAERQPMTADLALAKRLLASDEAAFASFFDDLFPRLYRYVLRRVDGDSDEARDVVSQTFCRAFEHLDEYRGEASLFGWMCQSARNALIDRARRRGRHEVLLFDGADDTVRALVDALQTPTSDEPEQAMLQSNLSQLIQTTLDCIPAHYANVLEWKYLEGLAVNDIASRLAIAPKAAESLLTRARNAFKDAILAAAESADLLPDGMSPRVRQAGS